MPELPNPSHDDAAAAKARHFTRKVALLTGVFAVVLAVASLGGSNAMKDMLVAQQQASNQWAYFQAKYAREHLYHLEAEKLDVELGAPAAPLVEARAAKLRALRDKWTGLAARYDKDRAEIAKKAQAFERDMETARSRDPYFDFAGVLLQIAIILASIALVAESVLVYRVSLAAAVLGALLTVNGFTLLVRIPFLH